MLWEHFIHSEQGSLEMAASVHRASHTYIFKKNPENKIVTLLSISSLSLQTACYPNLFVFVLGWGEQFQTKYYIIILKHFYFLWIPKYKNEWQVQKNLDYLFIDHHHKSYIILKSEHKIVELQQSHYNAAMCYNHMKNCNCNSKNLPALKVIIDLYSNQKNKTAYEFPW